MRSIACLLVAGMMAGACAADDPPAPTTRPEPTAVAPGEVSVLDDGTTVAVSGFLFIEQETRLCEAMLESYPPQCGGGSVTVTGLDPADVVGLSAPTDPTFAPVTWTDYPLTLLGTVAGGTIEVSAIGHQVFSGEAAGIVTRVMPIPIPAVGGIVFAMDAVNTTGDTVVATFADGQTGEVVLTDPAGAEVYRWSDGMAFDQAIRTIELPAGGAMSAVLNDELLLEDGWELEGWFVADTLSEARANGTIDGGG